MQQARNARARALGFANDYERRIASGRSRGLTRSQSRGHPKRSELAPRQIRDLDRTVKAGAIANVTIGSPGTAKPTIEIQVIDARGRSRTTSVPIEKADETMRQLRKTLPPAAVVTGTPTFLGRYDHKPTPRADRRLTTKESARRVGRSPRTILRWIHSGKIAPTKVERIDRRWTIWESGLP